MDRPDREQIRIAIRPWCYEKGGSCSAVKHFLCKTCNSTIDALLALFPDVDKMVGEIFEELGKLIYENKEPTPPVAEMWLENWQALKSKWGKK